jgi:hypothetical protein
MKPIIDLLPTFYKGEGIGKKAALVILAPVAHFIGAVDRFNTPQPEKTTGEVESRYDMAIPGLPRRRPINQLQNKK